MDPVRGRVAVHRESHVRKLSVVVAVQNVLVVASLLVTVCVYWRAEEQQRVTGDGNVHIQFGPTSAFSGNGTLRFDYTHSKNMMSLADEKNQKIHVDCTGPYVLSVDVCYQSLSQENITGFLELWVEGSKTPVSSFTLQTSHEVCRGLHSIAFLRAKEQASLHLLAEDAFKIKNATVGLNYLLGTERQCYY